MDQHERQRLRHILRAQAFVLTHPQSHLATASAALIHGLPLWSRLPNDVSVYVAPGSWTGRRSGVVRRTWLGTDGELAPGRFVTTPARTWIDVAREMSLADALCAGDAGLRRGLLDPGELQVLVSNIGSARGLRRVEIALPLLDGTRESPLESASWAYFVEHGVPLPKPQFAILDASGRCIARVDAYWPEARLVGECDGKVKYLVGAALFEEKRREDGIRAQGNDVVRWGATDLKSSALARDLKARLGVPLRRAS